MLGRHVLQSVRILAVPVVLAALLAPAPAAAQEASPRPGCGAPPYQSVSVEPATAAPGDTVTVTVLVRDEPCYPDESVRHEIDLFAAREPNRDPAPLTSGTTDASGRFVHVERASTSTTYYLSTRDGVRRGGTTSARLTVDRTAGSCATALAVSAPSSVPVGSQVLVQVSSRETSTVSIAFRKRGSTGFSVRRRFTPPAENTSYKTSFTADDDYRLYAFTDRCDSPPVLVTAAPAITGPATVRRGSVVTLTVRAAPGMPLAVAFRRAGATAFTIRRTGIASSSGTFTTTYRADADYEYYAAERPGQQSARRITQAR